MRLYYFLLDLVSGILGGLFCIFCRDGHCIFLIFSCYRRRAVYEFYICHIRQSHRTAFSGGKNNATYLVNALIFVLCILYFYINIFTVYLDGGCLYTVNTIAYCSRDLGWGKTC